MLLIETLRPFAPWDGPPQASLAE